MQFDIWVDHWHAFDLILVPVFYHIYGTVLGLLGMPLYSEDEFGDPDDPTGTPDGSGGSAEAAVGLEPMQAQGV